MTMRAVEPCTFVVILHRPATAVRTTILESGMEVKNDTRNVIPLVPGMIPGVMYAVKILLFTRYQV